jgi:hypothetical protein
MGEVASLKCKTLKEKEMEQLGRRNNLGIIIGKQEVSGKKEN